MNARQRANLLIQQAQQDLAEMDAICREADQLLYLHSATYRLLRAEQALTEGR
jgi:mevalonate pyrophosphate decarboxylase